MFDWLKRLNTRRRDAADLAEFGGREFADMGVSRAQAFTLAGMPGEVIDRVQAMGNVFGLDAAELTRARAEWVEMIETCAQCSNIPQCRRFLRQDGHPGPQGAGFCPNRAVFAEQAEARPVAA